MATRYVNTARRIRTMLGTSLLFTLACAGIMSCYKTQTFDQEVTGRVYNQSNDGVGDVLIRFGRRAYYTGFGNGPEYTYFDSLRTDASGKYQYTIPNAEDLNYQVCCELPAGYSFKGSSACNAISFVISDAKVLPQTVDFELTR